MDCGHAPHSPKQDMVAQIDKALNTESLDLMASVIFPKDSLPSETNGGQ